MFFSSSSVYSSVDRKDFFLTVSSSSSSWILRATFSLFNSSSVFFFWVKRNLAKQKRFLSMRRVSQVLLPSDSKTLVCKDRSELMVHKEIMMKSKMFDKVRKVDGPCR